MVNNIDVVTLKKVRKEVEELDVELKCLNNEISKVKWKLGKIRDNCSHEIGIKLKEYDALEEDEGKGCCFICGYTWYEDMFKPLPFKNIIDLSKIDLEESEKITLAYNLFVEKKEEDSEISDSKIVEQINKDINDMISKNDKVKIRKKVV